MKRFPIGFLSGVLGGFVFLALALAAPVSAEDCAMCLQNCADTREQSLDQCDSLYDNCMVYCYTMPTPGCAVGCWLQDVLCRNAGEQHFTECINSCEWFPCCENNPCDDGVVCNGLEWCAPNYSQCQPGEPVVCEDDGLFCSGVEICDKELDQCVSPGNPCEAGETCDEQANLCLPAGDDDNDDNDNDDDNTDDDNDDNDNDDDGADDDVSPSPPVTDDDNDDDGADDDGCG